MTMHVSSSRAAEWLARLPHGEPFRFLSSIETLEPGRSGSAAWHVCGDEVFLRGHFPGKPIVPGVLLTEALAQLAGLVGWAEAAPGAQTPAVRLAHVDVKFKAEITPPARIGLHATLVRRMGALAMFDVEAKFKGVTSVSGSLTLADSLLREGQP
jgi:3-hydroxyacyl-[acyl-carrier-protein] dehydratase